MTEPDGYELPLTRELRRIAVAIERNNELLEKIALRLESWDETVGDDAHYLSVKQY